LFTQINWLALNPGLAWEYRALATRIELHCGIDSDLDGLPDTLENTTCTDTNDADNDRDGYDLVMFMLGYGRIDCDTVPCDYDLDLDGDVDEIDLFLFAEDYGRIDE